MTERLGKGEAADQAVNSDDDLPENFIWSGSEASKKGMITGKQVKKLAASFRRSFEEFEKVE